MSLPVVRPARLEDSVPILEMVAVAFGRTEEARLVHQLKSFGAVAGEWVAEEKGEVVGYALFSPVFLIGNGSFRAVCLAPLSVAAASRRRGLGSRLVRAGLAALRIAGADLAVVMGDPGYYGRFGFDRELGERYETPWPDVGDAFMAVALSRRGDETAGGALAFADALTRLAAAGPPVRVALT